MGSNLNLNNQIEEYINSHSIKLHPVQYEIIKYNDTLGEIKKEIPELPDEKKKKVY